MPSNLALYALGAGALLALFVLQRIWELRKAREKTGNGIPGIYKSRRASWDEKHDGETPICIGIVKSDERADFAKHGTSILAFNSILPAPMSLVSIADATAFKAITALRYKFPKPTENYGIIKTFGPNVVVTEGHEWQRHRKPTAPAFSERTHRFVWDESIKIALGLFESNAWRGRFEVFVPHIVDVTLPMALFVIGIAGFGHRISWDEAAVVPPGHTMTFKHALHTVAINLPTRLLLPDWLPRLRKSWREVDTAFDEVHRYMRELIAARRSATIREERFDLFSGLLDATDQDDEKSKLTDHELIGNVFIYQLAGHETTAHTLAFTFGLLCLYTDVQEKLYQHIISIIGSDLRTPGYDEFHKFTYIHAVINETLRLFPPAMGTIKKCAEDTVIPTEDSINEFGRNEYLVRAGTYVSMNFIAIHYNPKYWPEPHAFRPERFMDPKWPRDAFVPYSSGARGCIGRRFFEAEAVALTIAILSRYKITLADDPEWAGITDVELKREKVLRTSLLLTLAPARLPLVFTKRQ